MERQYQLFGFPSQAQEALLLEEERRAQDLDEG